MYLYLNKFSGSKFKHDIGLQE